MFISYGVKGLVQFQQNSAAVDDERKIVLIESAKYQSVEENSNGGVLIPCDSESIKKDIFGLSFAHLYTHKS